MNICNRIDFCFRKSFVVKEMIIVILCNLLLVGCGGDGGGGGSSDGNTPAPTTYTISATVTGLGGTGLVLKNNAGDDLAIAADGSFTFPTALNNGTAYNVTVATQPQSPGQYCSVKYGEGVINGGSVSTVTVGCYILESTIASGYDFNCSRRENGAVKCWGANLIGQLGLGDTVTRGDNTGEMGNILPALEFGTDRSVTHLAVGLIHSCAILDNGDLKCWGSGDRLGIYYNGDYGSRGDETGEMGDSLPAVVLGTGRTARQVDVGDGAHSCAVLDNGNVKCWGYNTSGQLGLGSTDTLGNLAGEMGDNLPTVDLGSGRTTAQIAVGNNFTCALLDNGSVKCWGNNSDGQLGQGDVTARGDQTGEMGDNLLAVNLGTGRTAVQIDAGGREESHVCAVLDTGAIKCWGSNIIGQLGLGNTNNRGDQAGEMGDSLLTVELGTGRTAKQVSAGTAHTCALLDNGSVKCWGYNASGQLGLGSTDSQGDQTGEMGDNLPAVNLGTGRTAKQISTGGHYTCALLDDDTIKCWGRNSSGQLGQGDTSNRGDATGEMGDNLPIVDLGSRLIITEIMRNPATVEDTLGEWIEIYNPGATPVDIGGCILSDAGTDSHAITSSVLVPAGGYTTLAASAAPGFTPNYVYIRTQFALSNSDDEVIISCNNTVLDQVTYDAVTFPVTAGASMNLNQVNFDETENDISTNWCAATTSYNGDLGTPGAVNNTCP